MDAKKMYVSRKRDIAPLLDWLQLELGQHADYPETEGVDYGHCGDLGHVREKLIETLAFLAQRDEKDIEDALADAAVGRERAEDRTTQ